MKVRPIYFNACAPKLPGDSEGLVLSHNLLLKNRGHFMLLSGHFGQKVSVNTTLSFTVNVNVRQSYQGSKLLFTVSSIC